jgi:hypothetical protein
MTAAKGRPVVWLLVFGATILLLTRLEEPLEALDLRSFFDWATRFLVFSSTERFRKKSKRRSKGLGEKRPNR